MSHYEEDAEAWEHQQDLVDAEDDRRRGACTAPSDPREGWIKPLTLIIEIAVEGDTYAITTQRPNSGGAWGLGTMFPTLEGARAVAQAIADAVDGTVRIDEKL